MAIALGAIYSCSCAENDGSCMKNKRTSGQKTIQPLKAGVAEGFLDAPIGTSMGGYGGRTGVLSPYQKNLGGSVGYYHRLRIKALALDNGGEKIIIVKTPLIFPTDWLVRKVAEKVKADSGLDLLENMIIGGTHSHSGPGRIWRLPPNLGTMGLDEYSEEVFRRIVNSIAPVIIQAVDNLAPAKIGYGTMENFDPQNHVCSDRDCENNFLYPEWDDPVTGELKDSRLVLIRVDKENGDPLAVVVNFGMHGTHFLQFMFTEDAVGAVENKVEEYFGKKGQKITALFAQGTGGDVSPRGEFNGHQGTQCLEAIGEEAAAKVGELYTTLTMETDVPLEIVSKRYDLNRNTIGYASNEWVDDDGVPFTYGAFNCGGGIIGQELDIVDCANPETKLIDGSMSCFSIPELEALLVPKKAREYPVLLFSQTRLTAARIGNLFIATLPGEAKSSLGRFLREKIQEEVELPSDATIAVFGYSQDHHLYLADREDWLQGGYETAMSVWGFKFGEFLLNKSTELVQQLVTPEAEDNTGCNPAAKIFDSKTQPFVPVDPDFVPTLSSPAPAMFSPLTTLERFSIETIKWYGGDPAVDWPVATLQGFTSGAWQDFIEDSRVLDNTGYKMTTKYDGTPSYDSAPAATTRAHLWTVDWETKQDFAGTGFTGPFRFRIAGNYYDGADTEAPYSGPQYIVTSSQFYILPASTITLTAFCAITTTGLVTLIAEYPANPIAIELSRGTSGADVRQISGLRMRDLRFNPNYRIPVTGLSAAFISNTTTFTGTTVSLSYNSSTGNLEGTWGGGFTAVTGDNLEIDIEDFTDPWGNYNGFSTTTTVP